MSHHVWPPQYAWGYDWPDDCAPPRVTYTHPPPAHARVALHLPPCQPRAGVNTDWSADNCAKLHRNFSYTLLPSHPAQSPGSLQAHRRRCSASNEPPGVPATATSSAAASAPPAQPTPPKPAADPVTIGQADHDHVHLKPAMANLGSDVAIGLCLAIAFALVRRFILDLIEPTRPSLERGGVVEHKTRQ